MSRWYAAWGKRIADIIMALSALVIVAPLLGFIALLITLEDGGRIIFRQRRIGRHGEPFELLKLRSMQENVGDIPSSDARSLPITRIGRIIRRTNLDELPQLVNILKGEMSIVGPRPALPTQLELIALRHQHGAYDVRPGLTGLAQVNAYDGMSAETKAKFDVQYAADISLMADVRIIVRTVGYLLQPPPVY